MRFTFVLVTISIFLAVPFCAQGQQILDVYDDDSGKLVLNLSKLTSDISEYELFFDEISQGIFLRDQSSVTLPAPSYGEHTVRIIVTSAFSGAKAEVFFILNYLPFEEEREEEEEEFIIPVPEFIQKIAKKIVEIIPGGDTTIDTTTTITTTAVAASSAIASASFFTSIADIINYLIHVFISILEIFGIRKRSKPWGTVYDSVTKKPIPFVKVKLLDEHSRILESKITDKEGRFGFLISPKSLVGEGIKIQLIAEKKSYSFPSAKVEPPKDTILYENVYAGGVITIQVDKAANFDLPMDPEKIELKEVVKIPARKFHNFYTKIIDFSFWVGFITAPLGYLSDPNLFSFIILILFLILAFFRVFGLKEKPYGLVIDAENKKPMPFALITLNDKLGHRKGFTVSDERGRYFLITPKGDFNLNIFTPADIQPQRSTVKEVETKKGWIAEEIKL